MSNVVVLSAGGLVSREQVKALEALDEAIAKALTAAKEQGVAQGLIVSVIHAHNFVETQKMVTRT